MAEKKRIVYQEFGNCENKAATARSQPELAPEEQQLRVQASRKGRKGKTVTEITGFQCSSETLSKLLKKLKSQCGSGGTAKENRLEIQGEHQQKLVEILTGLGYKVKVSGR